MVDIIAHRGASKLAPENTLSAIQKAIVLSVNFIEIDVHLSLDAVPIVIHDAFPERTTNSTLGKRVTEMTLQEIKSLDAGSWFSPVFTMEKIPTLEEILTLNRPSTGLMIEIKKGHSPLKPLVHHVCELASKYRNRGEILIGSFSPHIIEEIQTYYPHQPLIGIAEDFNRMDVMRIKKLPKLALWYKLITPNLVRNLHDVTTQVWAFTVDDIKIAEFLLSIGVDGLITNDPFLMQSSL